MRSRVLGAFRNVSLIVLASAAGIAGAAPGDDTPAVEDGAIAIGSTVSFGKTPVGVPISRSFRIVNTDKSRPMKITDVELTQDPSNTQWAIRFSSRDWIQPGESTVVTITFFPSRVGKHSTGVSWDVEREPAAENEEKLFTFDVVGEAFEKPKSGQD